MFGLPVVQTIGLSKLSMSGKSEKHRLGSVDLWEQLDLSKSSRSQLAPAKPGSHSQCAS